MSSRIDIELTSSGNDASWTWRAVGAREPKGVIDSSLLPADAKVGDELRVEADFFIDGIEITAVLPPKGDRKQPELLEVIGSEKQYEAVTTSLVGKREGKGSRGKGKGSRRSRGDGKGGRGPKSTGIQDGKKRKAVVGKRKVQKRHSGREEAPLDRKQKAKRLRARRVHRNAVLAEFPEEQRPIAEQVLRGGIPGVRKAVDEQNQRNSEKGLPKIDSAPLLALAETMLPRLKEAEWTDRADAALAGIATLDLRDLRSVVVAADSNARSDSTRALAAELRSALGSRVDAEHATWLGEISDVLTAGRTVRALRMSSRPPKAGAPLPTELSARLSEAAAVALSADTTQRRWATVLEAVAFSPVRSLVKPVGVPTDPEGDLLEAVKRMSTRVPEIAALFDIGPGQSPVKEALATGLTEVKPVKPPPPPAIADLAENTSAGGDVEPRLKLELSETAASEKDNGPDIEARPPTQS